MLLELLLLVHNFILVMLLFVLLMLFPLAILMIFVMITSFFPRINILRHVSKGDSRLHFRTKFYILLILIISWVHLCCIQVLGSQVFIDQPFGIQDSDISLSLVTCRKEDSRWRTWALTISVFCLEWLRYGSYSISLFMTFNYPCCNVTSSCTMWVFSYTLSYAYL
jgi:hypothetical protein